VRSYGGIIRGDSTQKRIALVFTGDEFADGGRFIAQTLQQQKIKASFFFTGRFYRNKDFAATIKQLKNNGNYLGAHSNEHLLYCDWVKRDSLLVTEQQFKNDLLRNYEAMKGYGIEKHKAAYFLPPYEWYNDSISVWTKDLGLQLINYTPGTKSTADYTTPDMKNYRGSEEIYNSIIQYEQSANLNGFILLVHIGTDPRRTDKFYHRLPELIKDLKAKGYQFQTVNQLLKPE
jgi:peptidoglycan/xylan/chitin deacetylase (PgdA/CDA1 family)